MSAVEDLHEQLSHVYGGQRFLVAIDVLQGASAMMKVLRRFGAEPGFLLAGRTGTGALPGDEAADWVDLQLPPQPMLPAIHAAERAFREGLSAEVLARIDAWDPDGSARSIGAFFSPGTDIAGRRFFGGRPPAWQALEDKVVIDAVWDATGVARAPSRVVDLDPAALGAAASDLDQGHGTVWAGDARDGFTGGAQLTFWVRTAEASERALAALREWSNRARVMPFLEGLPCSIHGVVLPDEVLTFRPAEMVVLRNEEDRFVYARAATFWDPPPADRAVMRDVARRVGAHLRQTVGYRGAFTVDGVMTANGFLPTELNPRPGAAMAMTAPGVPWSCVHYALIEGHDLGIPGRLLEDEVVATADARRRGAFSLTTSASLTHGTHPLAWDGTDWLAVDEDEADATALVGPGSSGTYVSLVPKGDRTPPGSVAPRVVALARWVDQHLGGTFGRLTSAADVRLEA